MKKRSCNRFNIPGTTLYYKYKSSFFRKASYSENYFPVINLSKGGALFLCNESLKPGKQLAVIINIPNHDRNFEILSEVRWVSKNREASYHYQVGIAFNPYGNQKNENAIQILTFLEALEVSNQEQI